MKTIIQRINDLARYVDDNDENRDIVFDIICKLRQSHEEARKNEYTKQKLSDLIFSQNNCLAGQGAARLPEDIVSEVKNLQQEIVDSYGLQD